VVWLKKYESYWKTIGLVLFFACVAAIARTGYYGGELVYKHAAGVQFNLGNDFNFGTDMNSNAEKTEYADDDDD